ncbi:hypothetical protein C5D47_06220 [Rathayibacter toxicus]|uniref:Uncharacterized protein n=1 Tax=Rathayibacter toxicus TaxID=145458 RepID=A0A2S5Y7A4_9MICO|nr:hypothetical protein C5D17_06165 [Rathayibacter toxicus]PPH57631.1 hypothetical protein C5D30_06185 [Rathayibacter toxicus]PPH60125.1 hypothetical protein C5C93_06215 [Rathayibacter toxicus]PPH87582.1 hypothetical protein C5D31_06215 [Rathayibacter toxicus]PPI15352.1 hypothetical protein C5C51_06165 [Rathayibacter toxicus]
MSGPHCIATPPAFFLALLQSAIVWMRFVGLHYDEDGETSGRSPRVLVFSPVKCATELQIRAVNVGVGLSDFTERREATQGNASAADRFGVARRRAGQVQA